MSIKDYTTAELVEEIARRVSDMEVEEIAHWCEDCGNFIAKSDADDRYNPCRRKHKMKFRAPSGISEAMSGDFGYYRLVCRDRTVRSE